MDRGWAGVDPGGKWRSRITLFLRRTLLNGLGGAQGREELIASL